jgi:hypothetical protein
LRTTLTFAWISSVVFPDLQLSQTQLSLPSGISMDRGEIYGIKQSDVSEEDREKERCGQSLLSA